MIPWSLVVFLLVVTLICGLAVGFVEGMNLERGRGKL